MIKAEVVFDGDCIINGRYVVVINFQTGGFDIYLNGVRVEWFPYLEQAIKYCKEH